MFYNELCIIVKVIGSYGMDAESFMKSSFHSARDIYLSLVIVGMVALSVYVIVRALMKFKGTGSFEILENTKPGGAYVEIGEIVVEDMGRDQDMMGLLVKKAKKRGADGVIILPPPEEVYEITLVGIAYKYV